MVDRVGQRSLFNKRLTNTLLILAALLLSLASGFFASAQLLGIILAIFACFILLNQPFLGLPLAIIIALFARPQLGTGSEVSLTAATVYVPLLGGIWLLYKIRRKSIRFAQSRANPPLFLFITMTLISLFIGTATWDVTIPRSGNFFLVQLSQWGIFALSALAFWMTADLVRYERQLQIFTWTFLWLAGILALLSVTIGASSLVENIVTVALIRAPFWVLLTGLTAGQLFFNPHLSKFRKAFLAVILVAAFIYAFFLHQDSVSNWIGVGTSLAILIWLRFPRWRWIVILLVLLAALSGILLESVYYFAGGDTEWELSGGSRLVLIERVIEVTMRNPITGLGPAAYRLYSSIEPLRYGLIVWTLPQVSSHNNWVDLYSHGGLIAMGLFLWFVIEIIRSSVRIGTKAKQGFQKGFAYGMLAAWMGALLIMMLADWILPFVYNIGFEGFPASLLMWFFLGGIVALENMAPSQSEKAARPNGPLT